VGQEVQRAERELGALENGDQVRHLPILARIAQEGQHRLSAEACVGRCRQFSAAHQSLEASSAVETATRVRKPADRLS
jgi:hypothetical protein